MTRTHRDVFLNAVGYWIPGTLITVNGTAEKLREGGVPAELWGRLFAYGVDLGLLTPVHDGYKRTDTQLLWCDQCGPVAIPLHPDWGALTVTEDHAQEAHEWHACVIHSEPCTADTCCGYPRPA